MSKLCQNSMALLLVAMLATISVVVDATHTHCHDHADRAPASYTHHHACSHSHAEEHHHTSHDRAPPTPHDDDDCAACRFLAQSWLTPTCQICIVSLEPVAEITPVFELSCDAPALFSPLCRAPPRVV